ncbi:unnamed protein product [Linum tenue]|uniref:Uncharacterized protein n=1 Tax=Linum tenue TaxID=586396 RepID=A0AAV0HVD3_9ROSI|nr:unnamed protein product [Linum tenue]
MTLLRRREISRSPPQFGRQLGGSRGRNALEPCSGWCSITVCSLTPKGFAGTCRRWTNVQYVGKDQRPPFMSFESLWLNHNAWVFEKHIAVPASLAARVRMIRQQVLAATQAAQTVMGENQ